MFEILRDYPELLTTATLGTVGVSEINKGSIAYQEGNFQKGSKHLLVGNGTLTVLAAINELIKNGAIGIYTGAQLPFALAGLAQFLKHHCKLPGNRLYQLCVRAAENFTALPALGLNIAIRIWLYKNGLVDPASVLDWVRHIGFMGLSTSFVMSVDGTSKILKNLTAKQERFFVTFSTRVALTSALGVDVISSGIDVIASQDLSQANLLALVWISLNAMALKQDFVTLDKEVDHTISTKLKNFNKLLRGKFFGLFKKKPAPLE